MSTASALLAAVCAAPDDDLPRLVYADWCDENGQPVRADFIRSQIELTRLEEWFRQFRTRDERKANGPEFGRRLSFLRKRVGALLDQQYDEAVGVPDGWSEFFPHPHRNLTVNRGFVVGVEFDPARVRWLPDLLPRFLGPTPAVTVRGVEAYLAGFAWVEQGRIDDPTGWEYVSALETDGMFWHEQYQPFPTEQLARLSHLPFPRLSLLSLRYWELSDEHASVLAGRFDLPVLRSLDLLYNRLTPVGVRALAEARWWTGLHELRLSCSPPVRELVEVLTAAPIPGLRSLTIGNNHELRGRVGERLYGELVAIYPNTRIEIG
jgi:uncharacterized protein (TIGR02996 family)